MFSGAFCSNSPIFPVSNEMTSHVKFKLFKFPYKKGTIKLFLKAHKICNFSINSRKIAIYHVGLELGEKKVHELLQRNWGILNIFKVYWSKNWVKLGCTKTEVVRSTLLTGTKERQGSSKVKKLLIGYSLKPSSLFQFL